MNKQQKLKLCQGCRNDFYNGNNDLGVEECWSLESAEVVMRKKVPIDQRPPWEQKPINTLSCHRPKGYVMVDPDRTC